MLKRVVSLLLVIALAIGLVEICGLGHTDSEAAGSYEAITDMSNYEVAEWRFADGLYQTQKMKYVTSPSAIAGGGYRYEAIAEDAYNFKGTKYDMRVDIELSYFGTNAAAKNSKLNGELDHDWESGDFNINSNKNGTSTFFYFLSLRPNKANMKVSGENGDLYYKLKIEIWLENGGGKVNPAGSGGVPFIIGPCWNANSEVNTVYSHDNKIFSNIVGDKKDRLSWQTVTVSGSAIGGIQGYNVGAEDSNKLYYYYSGEGHSANNTIEHIYMNRGVTGACELRMGYQAYSISYVVADDSTSMVNKSNLPDPEMIAVPVATSAGSPKDPSSGASTWPNGTNEITYLEIKDIYYGGDDYSKSDGSDRIAVPADEKFIELTDGTKLKVGDKIPASEMAKLGTLKMTKNVEVAVHAKGAGAVTLTYHNGATVAYPDIAGVQTDNPGFTSQNPDAAYRWTPGQEVDGKDGKKYKFVGWYKDSGFVNPFTIGETISANTDVYAKWELVSSGGGGSDPIKYKVEFKTPVGPKPPTQTGLDPGDKAKEPGQFKPGDKIGDDVFKGWYLDPEHTIPYDFDKPVNKDIILYADWEKATDPGTPGGVIPPETVDPNDPNALHVDFVTPIGPTPDPQVKLPGQTADEPGTPINPSDLVPGMVIDGYRFDGWYLDKELTIPYDFSKPLASDITLYAKWTKVGRSPKTGENSIIIFLILIMSLLVACFGTEMTMFKSDKKMK